MEYFESSLYEFKPGGSKSYSISTDGINFYRMFEFLILPQKYYKYIIKNENYTKIKLGLLIKNNNDIVNEKEIIKSIFYNKQLNIKFNHIEKINKIINSNKIHIIQDWDTYNPLNQFIGIINIIKDNYNILFNKKQEEYIDFLVDRCKYELTIL